MQIRCRCESCQTQLRVSEKLAGTKARCPNCQSVLLIPAAAAPTGLPPNRPTPPAAESPPPQAIANQVGPRRRNPAATGHRAARRFAADGSAHGDSLAGGCAAPPAAANEAPGVAAPATGPGPLAAEPQLAQPLLSPAVPQAIAIAEIVPPSETIPIIQTRSRSHGWGNIVFAVMGLAVLTSCLLLLATFLFWLATRGPQLGTLVVKIPLEIRGECELVIDDQVRKIDAYGPLEFVLPAGQHTVRVKRLDHLSVETSLQLPAGKDVDFTPAWSAATDAEDVGVDN